MQENYIDINQEALESFDGSTRRNPVNLELLKEAADYNIDLNALETVSGAGKLPEIDNQFNFSEIHEEQLNWPEMDVRLADMITDVLDSSERLVFLISDDKIAYLNKKAQAVLGIDGFKQAAGINFLEFVDKKDWNLLAENIGEMLTEKKVLSIHLRGANNKVAQMGFKAIYLPDTSRFAFILISEHQKKTENIQFNNLYDEATGLPNFFLFEDRVQMAVNNENYKDVRLPKDLIAVVGIIIDNAEVFRKLNLEDFMLKKISSNLVLSLKKNYTVARGLKFQFWVLMPDIINEHELEIELEKIRNILSTGLTDNFTSHDVLFSVGGSVFPNPARSAKKLIEQAIVAAKKAQELKNNSLVMFDGK